MRDQLEGLMERVEVEMTSCNGDSVAIRKVMITYSYIMLLAAFIMIVAFIYKPSF